MKNYKLILAVFGLFLVGACNSNNPNPQAGNVNPGQTIALNQQLAAAKAQADAVAAAKTALADQAKKSAETQAIANAGVIVKPEAPKDDPKVVRTCLLPEVFKGLENQKLGNTPNPTFDDGMTALQGHDYQLDEVHVFSYSNTPKHEGAVYAHVRASDTDFQDFSSPIIIECSDFKEQVSPKVDFYFPQLFRGIATQSEPYVFHNGSIMIFGEGSGAGGKEYPGVAELTFNAIGGEKRFGRPQDRVYRGSYFSSFYKREIENSSINLYKRADNQAGFQVSYTRGKIDTGADNMQTTEMFLIKYKEMVAR